MKKQSNILVQIFTSPNYVDLKNLSITFETMMYEHYRDNHQDHMTIFGVKCEIVDVKNLEKSGICPIYDEYVEYAQKHLDGSDSAVQLEYMYEEIAKDPITATEGEEDEV